MDREHELWGMALWVEKHHGDDGERYIRLQITRNEEEGEAGGVELWSAVADRYRQLGVGGCPPS